MSFPSSFLTGKLWKIATGAAAVLSMVLCGLLIASHFENRSLDTQRTALSNAINDPNTGYIARLTQARANVATLEEKVRIQNEAIDKLSAEGKAALAASERRLAAAQAETQAMERKLAGFLATKPQGATLEDRVRDIDERAMKEFVK